eukprot:1840434-Pyramimonas_sp.AAC.1
MSLTEGPSGTARMRPPHPVPRFVAPSGAPPRVRRGPPKCVRHTQCSISLSHRGLQPRCEWDRPHASATPSAALRGSIGSSTEGHSAVAPPACIHHT